MLKKIGMVFASIIVIIGLNGCMESNIDRVKNSVSTKHKSTTIGKAFDNWDNCKKESSSWSEFETDSGEQIVEFSCDVKREEFLKKVKEFDTEYANYLSIEKFNKTFQWVINIDDSIELDNVGITIKWTDGKIFKNSANKRKAVNSVYINKLDLDNEILVDNNVIRGIAVEFLKMYSSSKSK